MANLLTQFHSHIGQTEGRAADRLKVIYARFDEPEPGDAEELAALLPRLGLAKGDAIKDLSALDDHRRLIARREPLVQQASELLKELAAINAEMQQTGTGEMLYPATKEGKYLKAEADHQRANARQDNQLRASRVTEAYAPVRIQLDLLDRAITTLKTNNLRAFQLIPNR